MVNCTATFDHPMLVIELNFPNLHFQERCVFIKMEGPVQACLQDTLGDSWMRWSEKMKRETGAMVLQEQRDFKGWMEMELPFPPLLGDLPQSPCFLKLVKLLVPSDVSNSSRLPRKSYIQLWHPHVRSFTEKST